MSMCSCVNIKDQAYPSTECERKMVLCIPTYAVVIFGHHGTIISPVLHDGRNNGLDESGLRVSTRH